MSKMYKRLVQTAKFLETQLGTEWAGANEDKYDAFAQKIEKAYERGSIDDREFNSLAMIAFFDYPDGLKGGEGDDSVLDFTGLEEPDPQYHDVGAKPRRPRIGHSSGKTSMNVRSVTSGPRRKGEA